MVTREEMKQEAIRRLKMLDIYKLYIRKFASAAGTKTFFENFAGFYLPQEEKFAKAVAEVEERTGWLVYALTHEIIDDCEMLTMLVVTPEKDYWQDELYRGNSYWVSLTYAANLTIPHFSEAGDACFKSLGGGLKRVY